MSDNYLFDAAVIICHHLKIKIHGIGCFSSSCKKKFVVFTLIAASVFSLGLLPANASTPSTSKVIASSDQGFELEFTLGTIEARDVRNDEGVFTALSIPGGYVSRNVGAPALPTIRHLISMPYGATPSVQVLDLVQEDIPLAALGMEHPVYPAQPAYPKSAKAEDIQFHMNAALYQTDAFIKDELAVVDKRGTMRGVGVGGLILSPVQYNPVSKTLRVTRKCRVIVAFKGSHKSAKSIRAKAYSPAFNNAYKTFLNKPEVLNPTPDSKASDSEEQSSESSETTEPDASEPDSKEWAGNPDLAIHPVTYLIVASDQLQGNAKLNEFIEWKKQKGYSVIDHYVAASATITEIDTWIENQYAALAVKPSFLLIVGDESGTYCVAAEVNPPLGYYQSDWYVTRSDLLYGVIGPVTTGNYIPSMHVGRFSVRSTAELTAQVDKTIWYEKGQFEVATPDLDYLTKPLGAAGGDVDGYGTSHGNPQIAYGWNHYFNATYGMDSAVHYLDPTAATKDSDIRSRVSTGVNFYNYTAHGWEGGFADPGFNISDVNGLSNANKYPLVVGNCCLTGSFGTTECFGEAWLNRANGGGIGFIGASINTTWNEDLVMGAGTASIVNNSNPPLSQNLPGMYDGRMMEDYPSQGATKFCGLLAVENYGGLRRQYWSAYHLFGDPSLNVYFGIPEAITVVHESDIVNDATHFTVSAGIPNVICALYDPATETLHGAAETDASGNATIAIAPAVPISANLILTITAVQKRPYQATISVVGRSVGFVDASYDVPENGGSVRIFVKRIGDPSGAVSVDYATMDGTAVAGTDYTTVSGTLNWLDGSMITNHVDITVLDDDLYSGDRAFLVQLSNPSGDLVLGLTNATVTILEDEVLPSVPVGLVATLSVGKVDLSWDAASDATGYKVNRSSTQGGEYTNVFAVATTNYTDSTVIDGSTYYYVVTATNPAGETDPSSEVSVTLPHTVPFTETFDGAGMASTLGDLDGQRLWAGSNAVVEDGVGVSGKGLNLGAGTAEQTFSNGTNTVTVSVSCKPVPGEDPAEVSADSAAVFWVDTNLYVRAYSNTTALTLPAQINTNNYTHFEVGIDYDAGTWQISVNGTNAASGLGLHSARTNFTTLRFENTTDKPFYIDNVSIASALAAPTDYELWLSGYGFTSDDSGYLSSNGVNTILEAYIAGLDPTDPASVFAVTNIGNQSGAVITWGGVSGRLYNVYWSSNLLDGAGGFHLLYSNIPWNANSITDTVHSAEDAGFYRIDVQLAE